MVRRNFSSEEGTEREHRRYADTQQNGDNVKKNEAWCEDCTQQTKKKQEKEKGDGDGDGGEDEKETTLTHAEEREAPT